MVIQRFIITLDDFYVTNFDHFYLVQKVPELSSTCNLAVLSEYKNFKQYDILKFEALKYNFISGTIIVNSINNILAIDINKEINYIQIRLLKELLRYTNSYDKEFDQIVLTVFNKDHTVYQTIMSENLSRLFLRLKQFYES